MWIRLHIFVRIIEVGEHRTYPSRSYIFLCRMEPFSNNTVKSSERNPKIVGPHIWETQTIDPGFNSDRTVSVWRKSQRGNSPYASQAFLNIVPINLYLEASFMWYSDLQESWADAMKFFTSCVGMSHVSQTLERVSCIYVCGQLYFAEILGML
jgi:hypothetical protein